MKDYRVTVKVTNNRIAQAIEAVGGVLGGKWAEANGICYASLNKLVNMTMSPIDCKGELRPIAVRLCEVLDKLPEDLWSDDQIRPLEKNFTELEMDHGQIVSMLASDQQFYLQDFSKVEKEQTADIVRRAVCTLDVRQQWFIRMRFEDDLSLEDIGRRMRVSKERVRQIEAAALRKLRHPDVLGSWRLYAALVDVDA